MKYHIKTFGCQMNISDSERIATFLERCGFSTTEEIKNSDLVIFNTCGIKQTAENRAYSMINNLRKEKGCDVKIIMTGCLANRADVQKRMKDKVDLFTEIKDFPNAAPDIIDALSDIKDISIHSKDQIDYLAINPKHNNSFQAYVPIMTGCNNFCAYCVVPHARGREISRPAKEIISEIRDLVSRGYKSITLLGQNVNSYKSPTSNDRGMYFAQLIKKIDAISGNFWIYFVSSHPKDMSDELIEAVTKCKKVCENIHLPVQAGDDEILRRMNRHYTQKHYLNLIRKIKKSFKANKPEALFSITSDIIVGFPGETRKQFLESAAIMEKSKFDMVFFGQFSPRPETKAWDMKDNVSQAEKFRRENFLNDILKKTAFANNKKYIGKTIKVLVEKEKNGIYFGKTRTLKNVKIITDKKNLVGTISKVTISTANTWNLIGEII
jgi:tRNA-2-methylthio-N6-dimethylallyladenosine synthase